MNPSISATRSAIPAPTPQQKREAAGWLTPLARIGFASIAVVYMTIGFLALLLAVGKGGDAVDQHGAVAALERLPGGKLLLVVLALGMGGYALWRLCQGFIDLQEKGTTPKGVAIRVGYVASGLAYAWLAVYSAKHAMGGGGERDSEESFSEWLLASDAGPFILGALGLAVIAWGAWHLVKAYQEKFMRHVDTARMSAEEERWMRRVGKLGLSARGVVLITAGILAINGARKHDPHEVQGIDGALRELGSQAYGAYILGGVALGLIAYGLYWAFNVRYRRICG